ncbi:MAG TPA: hypothetical protein VFL51_09860 [Pseudolabrys sp.]|nr:hypothetical protein [Pseudolabrys sp.]
MISRKLILAGAAILALSGVAQAQNAVTTTQIGVVNSSTTSQSGGVLNLASLNQIGVVNSGTVAQSSFGLNASQVNQLSFFGSNTAAIGQAGIINLSGVNQVHFP